MSSTRVPIKVLIADDHEVVRNIISSHLSSDPDIEIVGVTDGFRKAMEVYSRSRPHVVLMDLHMSDEKRVTPELVKSWFSQSQLLAMSIWSDHEAKVLADAFGAHMLLDKSSLATELIPAIKRCAKL